MSQFFTLQFFHVSSFLWMSQFFFSVLELVFLGEVMDVSVLFAVLELVFLGEVMDVSVLFTLWEK